MELAHITSLKNEFLISYNDLAAALPTIKNTLRSIPKNTIDISLTKDYQYINGLLPSSEKIAIELTHIGKLIDINGIEYDFKVMDGENINHDETMKSIFNWFVEQKNL